MGRCVRKTVSMGVSNGAQINIIYLFYLVILTPCTVILQERHMDVLSSNLLN